MRLAFPVIAAAVFALLSVTAVFAHAEPATAKPGDGAVLTSAPAEIVIVMSRRAGGKDSAVFDGAGKEVTAVAAVVDNNDRTRLSVAMPSDLAPGKYTVRWQSLSSEDGDPADGELSFTYDPNGIANPGKEQLREDLLNPGGPTPEPGSGTASVSVAGSDEGVTWILVAAVGIGMFVLGAGGAFLLVQKRP